MKIPWMPSQYSLQNKNNTKSQNENTAFRSFSLATPWLFLIRKQISERPNLVPACGVPQAPAAPGLSARGVSRPAGPVAPSVQPQGQNLFLPRDVLCVSNSLGVGVGGVLFFSFNCQRNSWVFVGCSHRASSTTLAKRTLELGSKPLRATLLNPCQPKVGSLGGCRWAAFPGDFVEAHRWGTPQAGTRSELMDRLISRLDGPEPGLAGLARRQGAHLGAGI